ncbi:MAG: Lar family restriction alleviation protein [Firmicutes bacterium]|nr:Lar family restriction alleviation protein [Bacillota bacterium]
MNSLELEECPACRGAGVLTHEGGWSVSVECADCGAHTVFIEYDTEQERREAEKKVAMLWNMGKVIKSDPGE